MMRQLSEATAVSRTVIPASSEPARGAGMSIARWLESLRQIPVTLLVSALVLLAFMAPPLLPWFAGDLTTASGGLNIPAILGGHLLHWNGEHLFWDLGMFILLGVFCESAMRWRFYVLLVLSAILIPWAIMWISPGITSYRGLSGIDTALFSMLVLSKAGELLVGRDRSWLMFLAVWLLMCGKIVFEFWTGDVLFVREVNFVPVPAAHLVGAMIGSFLALPLHVPRTIFDTEPKCYRVTSRVYFGFLRWRRKY